MRAEERRRRIISAAQEVFSRTGLQGARTRDLASAAKINQATLFSHFVSKEDLFTASVIQPLLDAMQGMRERTRGYEAAASADELVRLAQVSVQRHLTAVVDVYPLLVAALFSDPERGGKLYREHIAPLLKERGEAIRGLIKDSISPDLFALATFGIFFAVAMDRSFKCEKGDMCELIRQLTSFVVFGSAHEGAWGELRKTLKP
jgi:TetR/AcrR family transcriptional regulator